MLILYCKVRNLCLEKISPPALMGEILSSLYIAHSNLCHMDENLLGIQLYYDVLLPFSLLQE